jgi:hypothetical protein
LVGYGSDMKTGAILVAYVYSKTKNKQMEK